MPTVWLAPTVTVLPLVVNKPANKTIIWRAHACRHAKNKTKTHNMELWQIAKKAGSNTKPAKAARSSPGDDRHIKKKKKISTEIPHPSKKTTDSDIRHKKQDVVPTSSCRESSSMLGKTGLLDTEGSANAQTSNNTCYTHLQRFVPKHSKIKNTQAGATHTFEARRVAPHYCFSDSDHHPLQVRNRYSCSHKWQSQAKPPQRAWMAAVKPLPSITTSSLSGKLRGRTGQRWKHVGRRRWQWDRHCIGERENKDRKQKELRLQGLHCVAYLQTTFKGAPQKERRATELPFLSTQGKKTPTSIAKRKN